MSVHALNRTTLLLPEFVKTMHEEIGPKACRKRWIGKMRQEMAAAEEPDSEPAQRLLAEICWLCPLACILARKR